MNKSNSKISELDLSVRAYNVLRESGYETVGQIADVLNRADERDLRNLKRKGSLAFSEIINKVRKYFHPYPHLMDHDYWFISYVLSDKAMTAMENIIAAFEEGKMVLDETGSITYRADYTPTEADMAVLKWHKGLLSSQEITDFMEFYSYKT